MVKVEFIDGTHEVVETAEYNGTIYEYNKDFQIFRVYIKSNKQNEIGIIMYPREFVKSIRPIYVEVDDD